MLKLMTLLTAISLSAMLGTALAKTVICQPIGDAVTCSDGTIAMPFDGGAYITRQPRDTWGQPVHREHEHHNEWRNEK